MFTPIVTIADEGNAKFSQQIKSGFIRTINWDKYQSTVSPQAQNRYLDCSINLCF